jgi:hypothetical protein
MNFYKKIVMDGYTYWFNKYEQKNNFYTKLLVFIGLSAVNFFNIFNLYILLFILEFDFSKIIFSNNKANNITILIFATILPISIYNLSILGNKNLIWNHKMKSGFYYRLYYIISFAMIMITLVIMGLKLSK